MRKVNKVNINMGGDDPPVPSIRPGVQVGEVDTKALDAVISRSRDLSIQDRATRDDEVGVGGPSIFYSLVKSGEIMPPWWSKARDKELRDFWKRSGHLSGTLFVISGKIATMNFSVKPRDRSITSQVSMAKEAEYLIQNTPEWGQGWEVFITKWLSDLLASDNGAFAEIIGAGRPDGPRTGKPVSLAHLDSYMCTRTSDPEYPVIYQDVDGKRYKLHYTRVLHASLLPSSDVRMNGVGFCPTSSAIDITQNLIDITRFKQEKMGSRPPRILLVGRKGISAQEILKAFAATELADDSRGLSTYRRMVAIAPPKGRGEIDIDMIDLASVPDGFNEEQATTLGMFAIALAFGVDARELWPATVSGATKADAMIQHLKARGRGPGQIMQIVERQINQKFLPPSLEFHFDLQDDEQDMLQAEVRDKRSIRHERDLKSGSSSIRVTREIMLDDGDISEAQFEQMELDDGRLKDGSSVLSLFFATDPDIQSLLSLSVDNPLDFSDNVRERLEGVVAEISKAEVKALEALATAGWSNKKSKARQALAALSELRKRWESGGGLGNPDVRDSGDVEEGGERDTARTEADVERVRNESDYRGDGEAEVVATVV